MPRALKGRRVKTTYRVEQIIVHVDRLKVCIDGYLILIPVFASMNALVKQFYPVRMSYTSGTPIPEIAPQSSFTDRSNRKCSDKSSVLVHRRRRSGREHILRARVCRPPLDSVLDGPQNIWNLVIYEGSGV